MRALVVEDHSPITISIKEALEAQGMVVDMAHDGLQGRDLAIAFPYDLIVLDRMLPALDGDGLCSQLRNRGIRTPVLMLTARDTLEDKVRGLDAGADDYMIKPFAIRELQARARALLRRQQQGRANLLEAADLVIDLETGDVRRGGRSISLGRKEFALLAYLLRHRGRIVSKDELLDHVWNGDSDPGEDTVRAHIKNLRKKVDYGTDVPLIRTVYGMGYKIEAV